MDNATGDGSNGYEAVANIYIDGRGTRARVGDSIGAAVVKAWAGGFPLARRCSTSAQAPVNRVRGFSKRPVSQLMQ